MIEKIYIYFFDPKKEGYTLFKTFIYSVVFLIAIFLLYKFVKKQKIKIDYRFAIFSHFLALPFSAIRVLEDYKIISSIVFITPWIEGLYIVFFVILMYLSRKFLANSYEKIAFILGILMFFTFSFQLELKNLQTLSIYLPLSFLFIILILIVRINLFNRLLIIGQLYEATITIINVLFFGFYEQHVLSRLILEYFSIGYLFIKLIFIIFLIKILDITTLSEDSKNFIKTSFSVLSFSIGTRNLLQALAY
ncbi:MAG: DUF63 family protein [Nanoarchaeales archaeon]